MKVPFPVNVPSVTSPVVTKPPFVAPSPEPLFTVTLTPLPPAPVSVPLLVNVAALSEPSTTTVPTFVMAPEAPFVNEPVTVKALSAPLMSITPELLPAATVALARPVTVPSFVSVVAERLRSVPVKVAVPTFLNSPLVDTWLSPVRLPSFVRPPAPVVMDDASIEPPAAFVSVPEPLTVIEPAMTLPVAPFVKFDVAPSPVPTVIEAGRLPLSVPIEPWFVTEPVTESVPAVPVKMSVEPSPVVRLPLMSAVPSPASEPLFVASPATSRSFTPVMSPVFLSVPTSSFPAPSSVKTTDFWLSKEPAMLTVVKPLIVPSLITLAEAGALAPFVPVMADVSTTPSVLLCSLALSPSSTFFAPATVPLFSSVPPEIESVPSVLVVKSIVPVFWDVVAPVRFRSSSPFTVPEFVKPPATVMVLPVVPVPSPVNSVVPEF